MIPGKDGASVLVRLRNRHNLGEARILKRIASVCLQRTHSVSYHTPRAAGCSILTDPRLPAPTTAIVTGARPPLFEVAEGAMIYARRGMLLLAILTRMVRGCKCLIDGNNASVNASHGEPRM